MYFASDNTSPVPPQVMAALARANEGYASSYGADPIMDEVRAQIRELFEAPEAAVYLVATGTTANALSLAAFCPPWGAVYCQPEAHINVDECGAPEFFTNGAKLVCVDGPDGKISPEALAAAIGRATPTGVHNVQPGMLSLTNLTEAGTAYSVAEIAALAGVAREAGLPVHLDGARFANALVATNATPAEMTWRAGVDVLSFGGTKNGLMGVEAVVLFDPSRAWEFELRRKRGGHLFSKHRYLSAQMQAYLEDGLWMRLARQANAAGQRLAEGLRTVQGASFTHEPPANLMFASMPRAAHARARAEGAAYFLNGPEDGPAEEAVEARFVTSWSTTDEEVDRFLALARG
ncbi:threonine aldolase family protein [Acidimangrovimonas sediminis]|uniref:threonine aldolase family protein n=1 Tax=Acidimangrovimonas sediminis TaxID=2056283 RepID=UPI000C801E18|nr:low specificity L-threonine aldolase [Acidimangrovimonas sediminis]